ncbi:outer membrane beta-barrel protein [Mucilaginibacter pocheonensis]|uniref:Outer membrane protein beta-barrel domain-containing protein n=1 Tax=Mucilaginibacter pocheonensis TaxID=398050 RepID=A0ABU1T561_9SPHI|nr:outer membrane beta-barrel protein [Mucilaginibacter pocheonensis]MDR6940499.1 hypothetical protein [Mucilaginibacter pocheonensis]
MKKILLALAILGGTAFTSFAQTKSEDSGKFSIGVEAGLPLGDAKNNSSAIFGGSLKYELPIAPSTWFTISAGYNYFPYKSEIKDDLKALGIDKSGEGFIPVKAGIKYYIENGFFAEGQLGAAFGTSSGSGTAFAYSPGIGYTFDGGFEAGVRYEGWSKNGTISQVGLRLAYRF